MASPAAKRSRGDGLLQQVLASAQFLLRMTSEVHCDLNIQRAERGQFWQFLTVTSGGFVAGKGSGLGQFSQALANELFRDWGKMCARSK